MEYEFCVVEWMVSGVLFKSYSIDECYAFMEQCKTDADLVILFGEEDIFW